MEFESRKMNSINAEVDVDVSPSVVATESVEVHSIDAVPENEAAVSARKDMSQELELSKTMEMDATNPGI